MHLLAIPQLAYDVPDTPANMNGGDSDTDLLLLRRGDNGYERWQSIPAPGGEDAEFFRIGDRAFLAVASIRTGSGPYRFATDSRVFEWNGSKFEGFQAFDGYAAKQWKHFRIDDEHFLALAQGVVLPGDDAENLPSRIYRWDGQRFAHFQDIESQWAYNWHAFTVDGRHFLAHADHVRPSVLYRWTGTRFEPHQELADRHGRAFAHFTADGETFLLVARLQSESVLLRWDGARFVAHQALKDPGAREFAVLEGTQGLYVVRVNFVLGTPDNPTTALNSQLYLWRERTLVEVEQFPTTGATDAAVIHEDDGTTLVAVSHSLTADLRFAARTVLYRFAG
ncbi:hypothetical protein GKO32_37240 [Amycolatopsis sp. RM579]|uniref:EPTP domain-containing protein n=2 Tax=Amycolatopsis pithecellobii TaxID=664692 RepID=A0A6N7ZCT6_9PSEU|nr:hypothetical protein [Amycolatopsis pithecellobii]